MKKIIVSYSRTGRNLALATELAKQLSIEHTVITEKKNRNTLAITRDLLFNSIPKINGITDSVKNSELVILVGPVWLGKISFPLRACLKEIRNLSLNYAFISLSGGGDGPESNPNLTNELKQRTGKDPLLMLNFHVADFLPQDPKPTPQEIDDYKVTYEDVSRLVEKIKIELNRIMK